MGYRFGHRRRNRICMFRLLTVRTWDVTALNAIESFGYVVMTTWAGHRSLSNAVAQLLSLGNRSYDVVRKPPLH